MSRGYQERIRPIEEDGIKSIEAQIGYKQRKISRLGTFFKSDKHLETIEGLKKEITKLKKRLKKRVVISR